MTEKIRFSEYVYNEIISCNFHHYYATKLTRLLDGHVGTKVFELYCGYKWFGLKKYTILYRIDDSVGRTRIKIKLSPKEEELLWSVWPIVEEFIDNCRAEDAQKHLEYTERMSWWP